MTALRLGEEGRVSVLLHISAAGRVTACSVTESSGFSDLDKTSCALFKARARLAPARDANGAAQEADYRTANTWSQGPERFQISTSIALPVSHLAAAYRQPVKTRVLIDGSGHVASCDIQRTSGSDAADRAVCTYLQQAFTIAPPKSGDSSLPAMAVRFVTASLSEQQAEPSKP